MSELLFKQDDNILILRKKQDESLYIFLIEYNHGIEITLSPGRKQELIEWLTSAQITNNSLPSS